MSRTRYLIAYDISAARRLGRGSKHTEGYGDRLQYSVFICDLTGAEFVAWKEDILDVMELTRDSVVTINLGPPGTRPIGNLGTPRHLPTQGPTIV